MARWIDRQKNVLDFALLSLWRRKGRNLGLVLVYTAVVFLLGSVMFLTQSLKREAVQILRGAPELVVQKLVAGRHDLIPLAYAERLGDIRGVAAVKGRLWGYYFDTVTGANWTLMVPPGALPGPGQVFVGNGVARTRGLRRGDSVAIKSHEGRHVRFSVGGLFSTESELVSTDLVLVSAEDFRRLFGIADGYATDLAVRVLNAQELPTIAAKVQQRLPDTRVILRDDIARTYEAALDWRGGLLVVILSSSLLAFLIFVWDKASGLSAEERREIGVLKAVGWETSDVILLKSWEGTAVTLTAFFIGSTLAYAHVFFSSASLFAPVLKGWSVLYPEFRLVPFVDAYQLATLFLLTVLPYTAATIIPSWRAATIDPDSVMRA